MFMYIRQLSQFQPIRARFSPSILCTRVRVSGGKVTARPSFDKEEGRGLGRVCGPTRRDRSFLPNTLFSEAKNKMAANERYKPSSTALRE